MDITIPETFVSLDIVVLTLVFYNKVEYNRELFREKCIDSIIDDSRESIQQLLYRLKRLE